MLQLKTIHQDTYLLLQELSKLGYLNDFALAGGTSLALQLGHRISVDLDFFTLAAFDSIVLLDQLKTDYDISNVTTANNTLSLYIRYSSQNIKVEFLRHNYKRLNNYVKNDSILLYSKEDIAAMKLNAIANRGSKKDFYDIYELLKIFSITELLDFFKEKYHDMNAFTVIKSLHYFEDADLEPDPMSLRNESWDIIKKIIRNKVNRSF